MKNKVVLFGMVLLSLGSKAQLIADPVKWDYKVTKDMKRKKLQVKVYANMKDRWHIYSFRQPANYEHPGMPTSILFSKNPFLSPKGQVREIGEKKTMEDEKMNLKQDYFENTVSYIQEFDIKKDLPTVIHVTVGYMPCTDDQCLPAKETTLNVNL